MEAASPCLEKALVRFLAETRGPSGARSYDLGWLCSLTYPLFADGAWLHGTGESVSGSGRWGGSRRQERAELEVTQRIAYRLKIGNSGVTPGNLYSLYTEV